jgi:hypothetical protein
MPGKYTWGEKFKIARLDVKDARQVIATGDSDSVSGRRQDRIHARAEERWYREANAALGLLETADNDLARAEATLRAASGPEKAAARKARNDARDKQRRADQAARKYR